MNPTHIERPNYFAGEALVTADFVSEQQYHIDIQRHNNRALHSAGIANGLEVNWYPGSTANQVSINAGMALDREGREIILLQSVVVTLSAIDPTANYFLTIRYNETYSDYSDETGAAGYKRIVQQPLIEYLADMPDPGLNILLAVLDFSSSGAINRLSYKVGEFERRYVGSVVGSVQFLTEGTGVSQSRSTSALGSFIGAPRPVNVSISARKETSGDQSYLLVDAQRTQFSGMATTRAGLGIGIDQPNASLQVDAAVVSGKSILLSSDGTSVTLSDRLSPFFDIGDVLIPDPSTGQVPGQRRVITGVNPESKEVTIDKAFSAPLAGVSFTYLRSTLARFSATNGLIGSGSLMHIEVDGSVGLGMQASTKEGTCNSGRSALIITPDRKVGIGMDANDPQSTLDVNGDITASGRIIANSFEGNGAKLKNLPMLSYWTKESVASDTSNLFYNTGNVGIRCNTMPGALTVGGGKSFLGNGLLALEKANDGFTVTGYQTRFTEQVNLGDTIVIGQIISQAHVILRIVSDTELYLEEQFPVPVVNSAFQTQTLGSTGAPIGQTGKITSNGTQIIGKDTTFTSVAQAGDSLVIAGLNVKAPSSTWSVTAVGGDTQLTLQPVGPGAAVASTGVAAFIVRPSLLGYFQADQSDAKQTMTIAPSLPAAMLIASNGNTNTPQNTVAINVALADIDRSCALQVNGGVNFCGQSSFTDVNTVTLEAGLATIGTVDAMLANIDKAVFTGPTTLSGTLDARQAQVNLLNGGQQLSIGSWDAPANYVSSTDGFVACTIGSPADYTQVSVGWMLAGCGPAQMVTTGGNQNSGDNNWNSPSSFLLPVAANVGFWIAAKQCVNINTAPATFTAVWLPSGSGSLTQVTDVVQIDTYSMPTFEGERAPPGSAKGERLLAAFEKILGKTLDADQGAELLSALTDF
jgi:hypothetical protein